MSRARNSSPFSPGGESEVLMHSVDWSRNPLGHPEAWPEPLRIAAGIIFDSRLPMFLAWGPELIFLYNDGYRPILGAKHPSAFGRPFQEIWPEIWSDIEPLIARALAGEATWSENLQLFMHRSGYLEEVYFTFSYSPLRNGDGGFGGMLCACAETTAEVLGIRRLRTLRDLAAEGGKAKTVEQACHLTLSMLQGHDIPFAVLYRYEAGAARLLCAANVEEGSEFAPSITRNDVYPVAEVAEGAAPSVQSLAAISRPPLSAWGEPVQQAFTLSLFQRSPGGLPLVLVLGINPRRVFDENYRSFFELLGTNAGTAIANAQAYEEQKSRAAALAELDRAKTTFFSNVSHEFRTPLTLLLGPLEEVLQGADGLNPRHREPLAMAHRNGLRLLRLVNTLLDFSRIEAGRAQAKYEPTDLCQLTEDLAGVFRSTFERAGLSLIVDCEPLKEPVYVDREMWEKLVLNLLSNAFKFTLEGSASVRLRQAGGHAVLTVSDTGIGIPNHEIPHVFERFHRVRGARGRSLEGTGIGLALVQEMVRLHGGSITVESVVGDHTTFTVAIPLGSAHLAADKVVQSGSPLSLKLRSESLAGATYEVSDSSLALDSDTSWADAPPDGSGATILLADDNADVRDYVQRLLGAHYRVSAVANGDDALASALANPPDLVLSDVMMPGLDGFALLRELRANPRTSGVPIILLSARAGEEARIEGMEAGADDYLVKPFIARELQARVRAHLEIAKVRKEATEAVRRSAAELALVSDNVPALIAYLDAGLRYRSVNRAWENFFGFRREDKLGLHVREVIGERFFQEAKPRLGKALQGEVVSFETWISRGDSKRNFSTTYTPDIGEDGKTRGIVVLALDITDRTRAEEALKESEQRFRNMADNAPVMVWVTDQSSFCTYLNQHWYEFTGQTPDTGLGHGWLDVIHPADREEAGRAFLDAHARRESFSLEYRMRRKDGQYRWAIDKAAPRFTEDGSFAGYIGSVIDISERKQMEEALAESEARYRALFESAAVSIWEEDFSQVKADIDALRIRGITDFEAYFDQHPEFVEGALRKVRLCDVNDATLKILRAGRKEELLQSLDRIFLPETLTVFRDELLAIAAGEPVFEFESPLKTLDGDRIEVLGTLAFPASDPTLSRVPVTLVDITERRRVENERTLLLKSVEQARQTAELLNRAGPLISAELDSETLIQKITDLATALTGAEIGLFLQKGPGDNGSYTVCGNSGTPLSDWPDFPTPTDKPELDAAFRALRIVCSCDLSTDSRYVFGREAGTSQTLRSYLAAPVTSRSGVVLGGLCFGHRQTDVFDAQHEAIVSGIAAQAAIALDNARLFSQTEQDKHALATYNEELRKANADLEQFAYSASHDLQEPIRNIAITSELLARRYSSQLEQQGMDFLATLRAGAKKLESLVQDLLAYMKVSAASDEPVRPANAATALQSALTNLAEAARESGAQVTFDPLPWVGMREVHIQQVFQNLIGNAIKYRSQRVPEIHVSAAALSREWQFSVRDNGIGIKPEYRERIFGIFKRLHGGEQYAGTGIGLAICQRIVERYQGRIWVESQPGDGSTFFFTVPVAESGD